MTADQLTSVLHDRHEAAGAKFAEFGGWLMPLEYTGVLAEHTAVRERVGLFDVSHLGKALVAGPGAAAYLNTRLTNNLNRIGAGQAQYTLLCAEDGGTIDDLIAYRRSDDEVFLIPTASTPFSPYRVLGRTSCWPRWGFQWATTTCASRSRRSAQPSSPCAARATRGSAATSSSARPGMPAS